MGIRRNFSNEDNVEILLIFFRLLTMMQMDVHKTLYPV